MSVWLQIPLSLLSAVAGYLCGRFISSLTRFWWLLGYFIPLLFIATYGVAIHFPSLVASASACFWFTYGIKKYFLLGFSTSMLLGTVLPRLPRKRDRTVLMLFGFVAIFSGCVWPFLSPVFNQKELAKIKTHFDNDGICLQSTAYTCGPAAAVTVLHQLAFPADEGELAILSQTSSFTGTLPDMLAEALERRYGTQGLSVNYRFFKNLDELQQTGLTLAVVKYSFAVDHFVAVLKVDDGAITIGDPLNGVQSLSRKEFLDKWRFCGIVLRRKG